MPYYSYIAKNLSGEPKSGASEAKNEHELAKVLRREGYILISASIEERSKKRLEFYIPFFKKVSLVEKIMFARNLGVMIKAGIPLPRALRIIVEQAKNKKLKIALNNIADEITKGKSFSESLINYPDIFPELFSSMMKVGEESGTMEDSLNILVSQMEKEHELKSKIKGAMIYPAVIIGAMILIGFLMMILVIPKLAETFTELSIPLPLTTRIVIAIGIFSSQFWYLFPLFILVLVAAVRFALKTKTGKIAIDTIILRIPLFSVFVIKTNSARTVRTLSSLIKAGIPIVRSLEIVSRVMTNVYYRRAMEEAAEEVKKGSKLGEILKKHKDVYPNLVIQMIEVGEETGETSGILEKLAEFFEEEVANAAKNLSSVIEPVLMLIVGAAVGFFAVSMIQPIYSMVGAMK
ncbi:MAG: type II secretion system F family protein [Candidatus Pacebacteria bacterium]|nr:type II secretion system F family protein [Candidatus Paceibacterota bacterium]